MYRPRKYHASYYKSIAYERSRYKCEDCKIGCTSSKQLEQHLNGIKHFSRGTNDRERDITQRRGSDHVGRSIFVKKRAVYESSKEENTFPLEHMVVLDQTEEDLPNDNAASPASCDSSDSETAATASDFQTIDNIPRSHMVILDETNDDNDHPASPASCDSSASESAPSATVKTSDVTPKKKPRTEMPDDDQTAPEAVHGTSEKSGKESHANRGKTRRKESKKTFHVEPVKSNQDVFQFLKTFTIANESDVAFAQKVKEMFSAALRKSKEMELEEIFCTEAEHDSPEELMGSTDGPIDHEQVNSSMPQTTNNSECERINSPPGSPANSSTIQCIFKPTSSADCEPDSPIINQSDNPDTSSIALRSPTNKCEDIDTSYKPSATDSTNDNQCAAAEADLLMESEDYITAEAACSDDEDI